VLGNDVRRPWHGEFLTGLAGVLDRHGYFMLVGGIRAEQGLRERPVKAFTEGQVDGLVLAGTMHVTPALASAMRCIPTVVAGNHEFDLSDLDVVIPDDHAAATLTMDHLLGLGHRRIAHISGPGTGAFPIRRRAYEERMRSHGLSGHIMAESCDTTDDGGFAAAERLLTGPGPRPTALCGQRPGRARSSGTGAALADRGPGGTGHRDIDDALLAHNRAISLTSVGLKTERQGTLAGELMIRRIREPDAERAKLVMPPAGISIRNFTVA
jgi:transcriptional regulator, lacI family